MRNYGIVDDDFEARLGSAAVGTNMTTLGIASVINHLGQIVPPETALTTSQIIELVGVPTLTGILGCAVGAALGRYCTEHAVALNTAVESVGKVMFAKLPSAIGNTKEKLSVKIKQVARAIDLKAQQIVNQIKHKYQNKDNENMLSR